MYTPESDPRRSAIDVYPEASATWGARGKQRPAARDQGNDDMSLRNLVLVLGDQLDLQSPAFAGIDAAKDLAWMAELPEESEHV